MTSVRQSRLTRSSSSNACHLTLPKGQERAVRWKEKWVGTEKLSAESQQEDTLIVSEEAPSEWPCIIDGPTRRAVRTKRSTRGSIAFSLFIKTVRSWTRRGTVARNMKYKYATSLRELRSSLKDRSREYLLENTLHGVPYFVDPTRPKWERLTWFLLTMLSVIAIAVIIVIILQKFQTEPTIIGLDIMTEDIDIDFPQVFICFDWAQLNHSYINENEMSMYAYLYDWTWGKDTGLPEFNSAYENKNNFHSIMKTLIPLCEYLINDCTYRGLNVSCSKLFTSVVGSMGACCKSKFLDPVKITDVSWNLEFKIPSLSYPFRLYFTQHNDAGPIPGERPIIKAYFPIDIEFIVGITYTTPDIRYLLLRQRKCYLQEGVHFNDCEINCIISRLLEYCDCLPWFLSSAGKAECPLAKYSCLNNVGIDMIECDCWLPCDHTSYTVNRIKKATKDVNRIMLRNWPTALYKREMRFGYLDLLVSFGGIASLFLGYSLLTSLEFGYYFSLRTYCGAVIKSSRKQYNIVTVYVVEKSRPQVNINPTYYQYVD